MAKTIEGSTAPPGHRQLRRALLNAAGEVIGVNVAIASAGATTAGTQSGNIGVGFAIEVNGGKRIVGEIIATGSATAGSSEQP